MKDLTFKCAEKTKASDGKGKPAAAAQENLLLLLMTRVLLKIVCAVACILRAK